MAQLLTFFITNINKLHNWILNLNDIYGLNFTDKQLHFWIFGLAALAFYFVMIKFFKVLSKVSISLIAFLFTFTVLLGISLAIEVGQRITQQGVMDFQDVVSGMYGFLVLFSIAFVIELIIKLWKRAFRSRR